MRIIYSETHRKHAPRWEFFEGEKIPYAEKPERIESIAKKLKEKKVGEFVSPKEYSEDLIYQSHNPHYVDFIKKKASLVKNPQDSFFASYYIMDTYTPIQQGTYQAAKVAVDTAVTGAELLQNGEKIVYSLCRPPGHHAEHATMGGYCYFNNAAIAAAYLSKTGKVAILDVDFHHGNGTQQLFYDRSDVLYISIHADPAVKFPYESGFSHETGVGKGKGFTKNYPLPLGTDSTSYRKTLQDALKKVKQFNPAFLIVSLGFDTYEKDPIGGFLLPISFYEVMGKEIGLLKKSTLIVQEGGYAVDALGDMAYHFFVGISS